MRLLIRDDLKIGRDISLARVQRIPYGSDILGFKPVLVTFMVNHFHLLFTEKDNSKILQKWTDKGEVRRKSKILLNEGIHVEEDFSRLGILLIQSRFGT